MVKRKEILGLLACVAVLVLVSWTKVLFTGSIKVDDNPLEHWIGIATVIVFAVSLMVYGRAYYKFFKSPDSFSLSHYQIKLLGYAHVILGSLMLPILSNDIFLYLAYGDLSNMGYDVFTQQNIMGYSKWIDLVGNWKDSPYLYGPITLWISKFANWAGGSNIWMVVIVFKIIWLLIGICFVEIMSLMVKHLQDFILVLFTPVFWMQNVGGMHYDLLAGLFLLIAVYFISQQKIVFALIALKLAIMCKIVFAIFIPFVLLHYFFINSNRISWKPMLYFCLGAIASSTVIILCYLPFWKDSTTITIPFNYLNTQEPSKSFSEVLGEIFHALFNNIAPSDTIGNTSHSSGKMWWWTQFRIGFNVFGIAMGVIVSLVFMIKTRLVFYKTVMAEYWIKICLVFFFFYSHIFNAWYLIALLPFLPLVGNLHRLKKYILIISVYSNLHMIFLNIGRDSWIYYLLPPIIFINISLFLWQFRKNFLTVESPLTKD